MCGRCWKWYNMWLIFGSKIETTKPLIFKCVLLTSYFLGNDCTQEWSFRSPLTCRFQLTKGPKSDNQRSVFGLLNEYTRKMPTASLLMEIMFHCQFVFSVCLTSNDFNKKTPGVIQAMTQLVTRSLEVTMPTLPKGTHGFIVPKMALTEKQNLYFEWNRNLVVQKLETLWWKYAWICWMCFFFTCHHNFRWF